MKITEQRALLRSLMFQLVDPLTLAGMFLIVGGALNALPPFALTLLLCSLIATIGHIVFKNIRCYRTFRSTHNAHTSDAVGSCLVATTICALMLYPLGLVLDLGAVLGPTPLLLWWSASATVLVGLRILVNFQHHLTRSSRASVEPVVLAGDPDECLEMCRHLGTDGAYGLKVRGVAVEDPHTGGLDELRNEAIDLVGIEELPALVDRHAVARVVLCTQLGRTGLIQRIMRRLRHKPVTIQFCPDCSRLPIFCMHSTHCAGRPAFDLSASPLDERAVVLKYLEDKILGGIALLLFAPVMAACAILVRLTSQGPALYVQERHGLGGKKIRVFKFRSMYQGPPPGPKPGDGRRRGHDRPRSSHAHSVKRRDSGGSGDWLSAIDHTVQPALAVGAGIPAINGGANAIQNETSDQAVATIRPPRRTSSKRLHRPPRSSVFVQAQRNDPRITPIGHILRKTSFDELPQLFNVIRGDMSLVGPRPHAVKHNDKFTAEIHELMRRHYVKPGITGLAQVSGSRGETRTVEDMERRLHYDLEYIQRWSLWLDLKILAQTVYKGFYNKEP